MMYHSATNMSDPSVSVIIATRNRVDFLRESVRSVLNQTYTDLECIVIDGASTDGTTAYLESVDDDRLRVRRNTEPQGVGGARNAGIEMAAGEYIVFLDDDDRLSRNAIDLLCEFIRDRDSDCGGVYTSHRRRYESGKIRDRRVSQGRIERIEQAAVGGPSCTIVPAYVFEDVGTFDESFPACEDTDFWIRLLSRYYLVAIDIILYERRYHEGQVTQDSERMIRGNRMLLEKHAEDFSQQMIDARQAAIYQIKNSSVENPW